jgi:urocanate hydratase
MVASEVSAYGSVNDCILTTLNRGENPLVAVDLIESAVSGLPLQVERFYAALITAVASAEPSLGGKLLYAGVLDDEARALVVAANIAGAATLAATADAAVGKQAVRDGVVDFLVTSLDEALRILKNQIRKRETVAICIAAAPQAIEQEMRDRGVAPDLTQRLAPPALEDGLVLLAWRVASSPAIWLPKLDAIALDCFDLDCLHKDSSVAAHRWLRLAPRYLGRLAHDVRLLRCNEETAARLREQIQHRVACWEIGVAVELLLQREGQSQRFSFSPPKRSLDDR